MRKSFLTAAVLFLFPFAALQASEESERAKFKGKWVATAMTFNGMEVPTSMLKDVPWYWTIDDEKISSKRPGRGGLHYYDEVIDFAIGSGNTHQTIDITDRARKNETQKGIYELDGDTLKICFTIKSSDSRPEDFNSGKDTNRVLIVWKRVKN